MRLELTYAFILSALSSPKGVALRAQGADRSFERQLRSKARGPAAELERERQV